jgi:hypothetical protein
MPGSLLQVTVYALARYLRSLWFAADGVLLALVFVFCFSSTFQTASFFSSAAFLLGVLSAIGAYGFVHAVVPPQQYLPLARRLGPASCVGGLTLAVVCVRAAACLVLVGLALAFQRLEGVQPGPLLAGVLGLIVASAVVATVIICLSAEIAPRAARLIAMVALLLGFASFNTAGIVGGVLFVARLLLFPFIAPYRLGVAPGDLLAWLGTLLLAPAAIVGLIAVADRWLQGSLNLRASSTAADAMAAAR